MSTSVATVFGVWDYSPVEVILRVMSLEEGNAVLWTFMKCWFWKQLIIYYWNNYNLLLSKLWNIVLNPSKPIASTISFLLLHHCTIKTNISFINWISQSVRNNLLSAASKHSKNKGTYRRDLQATAYIWFHSYS